jgi:hypothetical protein
LITDADYQSLEDSFKSGRIDDPETLYQLSMRLKQVKQSAYAENERDSPLLEHLRRMQRLEELVEERGTPAANAAAKFYRLEAQAELTEVSLRGNQSDSTKAIPYQEENR